jgi:hypothetical protein
MKCVKEEKPHVVVHVYNTSYSGGRDRKDYGWRPAGQKFMRLQLNQ